MKINTFKTANNYKVMHIKKDSPISFILFLVKNGSRFESEKTSGLSHFIEHLMFKPTQKRKTSKIISTEIESIGGVTNAFTSNEYTGYYIQVLGDHFSHAFEILADLLQNGVLKEEDIKTEKGVVIEEIKMYEDSPSDKVHELASQNIFPNQQLGVPIIGNEENINSFSRSQIIDFMNEKYIQDNFLIVSVGSFEKDITKKNVEAYLKIRPEGRITMEKATFSPKKQINFHAKKDSNQSHTIISFPGTSMFDKEIYKYLLLETVLGTGFGSILYDLLREKLGVAYYVDASHSDYLDTGTFQINFGSNFDRTKETVDRIFGEIEKIKKKKVSEVDLTRAKNLLYSLSAMKYENVGYLAKKFGIEYLLKGEIEELVNEKENIYKISVNDILETANKVFTDNFNITYIANKKLI